MSVKEKIDLHMHTTISDGTDTPEEIILRVKEAGISLFSVTDHDALKGCEIVTECLETGSADRSADLRFVSGIEFSCKDEEGKYHILGYNYDLDAKAIHSVVALGHSYRMRKVHQRLDFLKSEFGFDFPDEEIDTLLHLDNPGKPHIGNLMAKYGFAESKDDAIKNYINKMEIKSEYVRPEEAIKGILESGGIPILAHPTYGSGDQLILGEDMDKRLKKLIKLGIEGVEAFYSGFTEVIQTEVLNFAEKYDLLVTAGSDYHGANKIVILGDTNLDDYLMNHENYPKGLERFLERIGI